MGAPALHPFAPIFPVLSAIHTVGGHYVHLGERAFRSLGVDPDALIDRRWQEFAPSAEVDEEIAAVRRALALEAPVQLPRVQRRWSAVSVDLEVTIIPIRSRQGTMLVMRRARLTDAGGPTGQEVDEPSMTLMADLQSLMGFA